MNAIVKMGQRSRKKILLQFANDNLDFQKQELESIASIYKQDLNLHGIYDSKNPFVIVSLPSVEMVKNIVQRSATIKSAYELYLYSKSYKTLLEKIEKSKEDSKNIYGEDDKTFRFLVDAYNKKLSLKEKVAKIEMLTSCSLVFKGKINLKDDSNITFVILEFYDSIYNQSAEFPSQIYFGRWICNGLRDKIKSFNLQNRKFIGNTSMEPTLSLIMSNMGKVIDGSMVFDPFVGSGSLLISAAYFGGYVMGADIDYNVIKARGKSSRAGQKWRCKDETICNNLDQYGLTNKYLDILISDASLFYVWRKNFQFDAIITDPPYGIRESTIKLSNVNSNYSNNESSKENNIPSKTNYDMNNILIDLLSFGIRNLRIGGRLVYWMPVHREDYTNENIPSHPCLKLIGNSEQILNSRVSRRLITMEKIDEPQESQNGDLKPFVQIGKNHYSLSFREKYFKPKTQ